MTKSLRTLCIFLATSIFCLQVFAQGEENTLSAARQLAEAQKFNFFTIPNQDAAFVRLPSRGASTEVDAVYHNPAGTTHLGNGWHLSINNQALRQRTDINASYQYLNDDPTLFEGNISTPVFPSIYLAYNKDKFAFSWGLNPIGGGGGAEFKGLPVAERNIADVVPNMKNVLNLVLGLDESYKDITGYSVDFSSNGLAFFLGNQLNFAYRPVKAVSLAAGVRYVYGRVSFDGHTRNIQINVPAHGGWQAPGDYLRFVAEDAQVNALNSVILNTAADALEDSIATRNIDAVQSAVGFSPIASIHIKPNDKLDIGIRYEHGTEMEFTTTVNDGKDGSPVDDEGNPVGGEALFFDGETVRSDLPSVFGAGIDYAFIPKLKLLLGGRYLLNTKADFDGREQFITSNYYELEAGLEWKVNEELRLSAGYTFGNWEVAPEYQTDVDFWTNSHTFAFGGNYALSQKVDFNVGMLLTEFAEETIDFEHTPIEAPFPFPSLAPSPASNTYKKDALIFAIGVNIHWLKNKEEKE